MNRIADMKRRLKKINEKVRLPQEKIFIVTEYDDGKTRVMTDNGEKFFNSKKKAMSYIEKLDCEKIIVFDDWRK